MIKKLQAEIEILRNKAEALGIYVADLQEQERFFRNSHDNYLHLTVECELRIAKERKKAKEECIDVLKDMINEG